MDHNAIQALTFDTGGTILDWHTGIRTALAAAGSRHGLKQDWAALTNEFRRRALKGMVNHGEHAPATKNFDDVHREALDALIAEHGLDVFTAEDRRSIWWDAIHNLACWPDFPGTLPKLRQRFYCVSFTLLSFRIIMDTAQAQWTELGRGHLLRGDRQVQGAARGLPDLRQVLAARSRPVLDGRVPQLRPRRRQGVRVQDGIRTPAG